MNGKLNIVKSCRICLADKCEKDEFVKLLNTATNNLNIIGKLYQELLGLSIDMSTINMDPQFLCNSCCLQLKLFENLKIKAHDNVKQFIKMRRQLSNESELPVMTKFNSITVPPKLVDEILQYENHSITNSSKQGMEDNDIAHEKVDYDENNFETYAEEENLYNLNLYDSVDYKLDTMDKSCSIKDCNTEYVDVFYLDDNLLQNNELDDTVNTFNKRGIQLDATKMNHQQIRKCFPCNECGKRFKTAESQQAHINVAHLQVPAYQCNLCPKTFNQRVHYNYHMNRHNNFRKFRCDICGKSFLSKTDLSIHIRFHNGHRPYKCDICGNDYSLMQHLKSHMYSHNTNATFECKICNQKFINPTTLKTHETTIHTKPRFKCEHCMKRFRRKHHLIAHYKVHERQLNRDGVSEAATKTNSIMSHDDDEILQALNKQIINNVSLPKDYDDGNVTSNQTNDDDFNYFTYNCKDETINIVYSDDGYSENCG